MKKKVLVVGPLSSGHIQKWISPFIDDFEFVFFTLHNTDLPKDFNHCQVINFPRLTNTRLDFFLAIPFLQYYVLKLKPNLLHANFLSSYGILSAFVASKCNKILSTWGTDVNGKTQSNVFLRLIIKKALSKYLWINAPAKHIKKKLIALDCHEDKIDVFQYGIDFENYPIKQYFNKGNVKYLSIRNWDALYNIDVIIKAYSLFCQKNSLASELTIIGRGDSGQEIRIKQLINSHNYNLGKVNLIGFIGRDKLMEILLDSDIVISIPSMDGAPLSLLEALYVGLFPVVSDIDANHEWLELGNAVFVNPDSVDSSVEGFEQAYKKIKLNKTRVGIESKRLRVSSKASYYTNTSRLKSVYNDLLI